MAVGRGLETVGDIGARGISVLGLKAPVVILSITVIGVRGHRVRVKREDQRPGLQEIIEALDNLNYAGLISLEVQEGMWHATTQGEVLQYTTPNRWTPVTLQTAGKTCKDMGARIWDANTQ